MLRQKDAFECVVVGKGRGTREDRHLVPIGPVDSVAVEDRPQAPGIEGHVVAGMHEQPMQIFPLFGDKPVTRPVLAFEQLIVKGFQPPRIHYWAGPDGSHSLAYSTVLPAREGSSGRRRKVTLASSK
jgi:hypothetical protein